LLGKNFLYGKSSPKRLKITNIVIGRSNERLDSTLMVIAAQPIKNAGTNHRTYQANFSPFLYAVREMAMIKKATPKSDKPPNLK
jgi:hypothetical protein